MLVPVSAEIKTHNSPAAKTINYTIRSGFTFEIMKDGQKVRGRGRYINDRGQEVSLHITKQFVFDLTKEVDRKNYAMLRVHLASDKELAQIIKVYDPQANAIQKISSDRLIVTLKNKLYDIEKDEEIVAKYYRRIFGSAKGIQPRVLFSKLLGYAETNPNELNTLFNDNRLDMLSIIDKCLEMGQLTIDKDGYVRDLSGAILAQDIDALAFDMAQNTDVAIRVEMMVRDRSSFQPTKEDIAAAANDPVLIELADDLILGGDVELMDESPITSDQLTEGDITDEFIKKLIEDGFQLGVIKKKAERGPHANKVTMEHITQAVEYKLADLPEFFRRNPDKAIELRTIIEMIEEQTK